MPGTTVQHQQTYLANNIAVEQFQGPLYPLMAMPLVDLSQHIRSFENSRQQQLKHGLSRISMKGPTVQNSIPGYQPVPLFDQL